MLSTVHVRLSPQNMLVCTGLKYTKNSEGPVIAVTIYPENDKVVNLLIVL